MQAIELKQKLLQTNLFLDNDYLTSYITLILNNLSTKRVPGKTQQHHILQRKWFENYGYAVDNTEANLVNLLYKDHILAHYYLCKCTTSWLAKANSITLINMTSLKQNKKAMQTVIAELDEFQKNYEQLQQSVWTHKITKQDLEKYYITENHTKKETADKFNCNLSCIDRWLGRYNLCKSSKQNRQHLNVEELKQFYLEKNYTLNKLSKKYKVSLGKIKSILKQYNIKKGFRVERPSRQKISISKDEFYKLYIIKNMSITDLANKFKVSTTCIKSYINKYNIHKVDKLQIAEAIKKGKLK